MTLLWTSFILDAWITLTKKNLSEKILKFTPEFFFCCCSLHKVFTHPPCKKRLAIFFRLCIFSQWFSHKRLLLSFWMLWKQNKIRRYSEGKNKLTYSFSAFESKVLYFFMRSIELSSEVIGTMFNGKTFKYHRPV